MAESGPQSWQFNPGENQISDQPLIFACHRRSKLNNRAQIQNALARTFPNADVELTDESPVNLLGSVLRNDAEIRARGCILITEATAHYDVPMSVIQHIDDIIEEVAGEIQAVTAFMIIIDQDHSEAWSRGLNAPQRNNPQGPAKLKARAEARNVQVVYAKATDIEAALIQKLASLKPAQKAEPIMV